MKREALLVALVAACASPNQRCSAFSSLPNAIAPGTTAGGSVMFATHGLSRGPATTSAAVSALEARRGSEEGETSSNAKRSSSLDRHEFLRSAVALAGVSGAILGESQAAFGVAVQPGDRTTAPPNPLLLVPALRAKLAVQNVLKLLEDPEKWPEAREALTAPPLAPADFKACFRTYSDADPEQHLAFDLYRIQAQEALKAVSELLAYLASEKAKGAEIVKEDVDDLDDAGRSVLQGIDDFLKLAPKEDVLMVEQNTKDQAATASKSPTAGQKELVGAVAGEGAFVAGAWVGR